MVFSGYMRTKKPAAPKRYVNIRIDESTYEAIRRRAYKERKKIIQVARELAGL